MDEQLTHNWTNFQNKRMADHLADLKIAVEQIELANADIRFTLEHILRSHKKSFEVVYSGEIFDFDVPFTDDELRDNLAMSERLIGLMLKRAYNDMVDNPTETDPERHAWQDIYEFARGIDPEDMQLEKFDLCDIYPVVGEDGNPIVSLPLNEDSTYVKAERLQDDQQDQSN